MNLSDLPIQLVSPYSRTTVVAPWGFAMECDYEYDEGEPEVRGSLEFSHPGTPPNAALLSCKVGGVDITEMLSLDQRDRIEEFILDQME